MLPFIIGGVALAATGYGIKKFLEDDDNQDKVSDAIMSGCDWVDKAEQKTDKFFDSLSEKAERYFDSKDADAKFMSVDLSAEVGEFMSNLSQFTKVKRDFLRKEILPNKKIIEQNGEYFTISTNVSYDDEILRLVKYWIPYIKIVSPQYLQDKLSATLKEYPFLD